MTVMMMVGALLGGALFALLITLAPPRTAPITVLARLDTAWDTPRTTGPDGDEDRSWIQTIGDRFTVFLTARGVRYTSLRQDLALTGRSLEWAMARKILFAAGAIIGCSLLLTAMSLGMGVILPPGIPVVLLGAITTGAFFLPDIEARTTATKRRTEFRRALGGYLDLVALEMAGSAAPAEALPTAAHIGSGWPLALIRDTLYRAGRASVDPWIALAQLGHRIGVPELRDLGQLIHLVAHDGARVRTTLTARATSMRRRELAELVGDAAKRDGSMRLAQVLIGLGFMLFLGFPAVMNITNF